MSEGDRLPLLERLAFRLVSSDLCREWNSGTGTSSGKVDPQDVAQTLSRWVNSAEERVLGVDNNVVVKDRMYVVIGAEPRRGILTADTEVFWDGDELGCLDAVEIHITHPRRWVVKQGILACNDFMAWGILPPLTTPLTFKGVIDTILVPYLEKTFPFPLYVGKSFALEGFGFFVNQCSSAPAGLYVSRQTKVTVRLDPHGEFERVHITPFVDTLPESYSYDTYRDYLEPYLKAHAHKIWHAGENFVFRGVQFRVVKTDPGVMVRKEVRLCWNGEEMVPSLTAIPLPSDLQVQSGDSTTGQPEVAKMKIGRSTLIYCQGTTPPSIGNLLEPSQLWGLQLLPARIQPLVLMEMIADMNPSTVERIIEYSTRPLDDRNPNEALISRLVAKCSQEAPNDLGGSACPVCLCEIQLGESILVLPCKHMFHKDCVRLWFKRSVECPLCKGDMRELLNDDEDGLLRRIWKFCSAPCNRGGR
eukprot:Polyplicarium_translucidae@DN3203_c0_g1_i1.p3